MAAISRLCKTTDTLNSLCATAIYNSVQGQHTPVRTLFSGLDTGGVLGGDAAKAALSMLAEGLKAHCVMSIPGAYAARKGADQMNKIEASAFVLTIKGIETRIDEFKAARAVTKAKAKATKTAKTATTDDAPTVELPIPEPMRADGIIVIDEVVNAALAVEKIESDKAINAVREVATRRADELIVLRREHETLFESNAATVETLTTIQSNYDRLIVAHEALKTAYANLQALSVTLVKPAKSAKPKIAVTA